ncbi:DUF433 domain-containing protein [Qipengyuania aquimaris]|uniref:DUF433 domain-containing protein n=1 Tax=Qipengyuania aquimaris TaxID=255984 RepID=UPI001CD7111E|nr:DUF433 domain-containing protein [Qipengyuania aquimaris]MCA0903891.1 DUF433 domain-containing protein [Qipengyuania aquimaris]
MSAVDFGIGIYTPPEAARMIGMRPATLRRWLLGYEHDGKFERHLWHPQYDADDDGLLLGFRDLIEARIVNALRDRRIGLQTIRTCIDRARDIVGDERPFSTREFKTDGNTIFLEITRDLEEPIFIDLRRSQGVFKRVVEPTLKDLDFGDEGAERWWLLPGKRTLVADPTRSFGQPIVADHGISTSVLREAVEAEGSVAEVAKLFEIDPAAVRDAVAYEERLTNPKVA